MNGNVKIHLWANRAGLKMKPKHFTFIQKNANTPPSGRFDRNETTRGGLIKKPYQRSVYKGEARFVTPRFFKIDASTVKSAKCSLPEVCIALLTSKNFLIRH